MDSQSSQVFGLRMTPVFGFINQLPSLYSNDAIVRHCDPEQSEGEAIQFFC
jgi:hypothetical protein